MSRHAAITGWGCYLPEQILGNQDLQQRVDTNDEWILTRTGIRERRLAGPEDTTTSMGLISARRALLQAKLDPIDLDLIICASTTADRQLPAPGCLLQSQLGEIGRAHV